MKILKAVSAKYTTEDKLRIDCEITLDDGRVLPFTASANDIEEHGRALHAILTANNLADYVCTDSLEPNALF